MNYEDDFFLAEIIIEDFSKRITLLRLPLNCFYAPIGNLLRECLESYKKNNAIDLRELSETSRKQYIELYTAHSIEIYNWKELFPYYEERIFNRYKQDAIKKLSTQLQNGLVEYKDFVKKINDINNFDLSNTLTTFKSISELPLDEKEKVYVKSGAAQMDSQIRGFALGELSIWSGGNASAKSTFMNQLALEAINQNFNVAIYSGELQSDRLISWISRQACRPEDVVESNGFYKPNDEARSKILYWLDNKLFVYENAYGNKAKSIIQSIRNCIEKRNIKVVIIDNLMSLDMNEYSENKYDSQSLLVKELSDLAKEYKVHIHFVCHPRKSLNFLRKVDISGTGDLTNVADNVFIMHRVNNDFKKATQDMFGWSKDYELYKYTNIIEICKNREFGVQDSFIGLYFIKENRRLINIEGQCKAYQWESTR